MKGASSKPIICSWIFSPGRMPTNHEHIRARRLRRCQDVHRRDFLHIHLPAQHVFKSMPDKANGILKSNHEAGHAAVGNRDRLHILSRQEKRNNGPTRSHHIAITYNGKDCLVVSESEFAATNSLSEASLLPRKVHRIACLVGRQRHNPANPASIQWSITFIAPLIFVFTHSKGLYSAVGTILVAAA